MVTGDEKEPKGIDYEVVQSRISAARKESLNFLNMELEEYR